MSKAISPVWPPQDRLTPKLRERLKSTGNAEPAWRANPVVFWDVFGERGFPVRATISDLGPLLLGRAVRA